MNTITFTVTTGRDTEESPLTETQVQLPAKYKVCPDCEGEGRVLTEAIRHHAYSREDMDEDPDFMEEYLKGGHGIYGVECPTCQGRTTVLIPDVSRARPAHLKLYNRLREEQDRQIREDHRTYLMECGIYGDY